VLAVINPVLTILFDLFLIGSALAVSAAMVGEYFLHREPHVGDSKVRPAVRTRTAQRGAAVHGLPAGRRAA